MPAHIYVPELEDFFREEIRSFQPDVIHSWGIEYHHALAMVNAAESENLLDRTVINIQGLCSVIAKHYVEGIPSPVQRFGSLRDLLRRDNLSENPPHIFRKAP